MANTSILDLAKPAGTDKALVSVINSNSDKIDAEAAKERGNFAGTYSTSSAYAVGAYCIYEGNLYRCTTAIGSGGEAWTAGHWTQVSVGEEITSLNSKIAMHSSYLSGTDSGTVVNAIKYNYDFAFIAFTSATKTWAEGDSFGTLPVGVYPVETIRATGNMYGSNIGVQIRIGTDGSVRYDSQNSVSGRISFTAMYAIKH